MATIEANNNGYLLNKKIYIGDEAYAGIALRITPGEAMRYGKQETKTVDFPGEYDIDGTSVTCLEADGKLSYIIKTDDGLVAVLHNSAPLEKYSFDAIQEWICADAEIKSEVERMEMEGDISVMGSEGETEE